jgi:polysaccharide biosynthesis/export protein
MLVPLIGALIACSTRAPTVPIPEATADSIVPAIWRERTSGQVRTEPCLGPGDLLEISVFRWPDLQHYRTRVTSTGNIELPLLGAMHVAGLSELDVRDRIAEALKRNVMRDPQVSVFVAEYVSQQVSVTGAVARPGLIGLSRDHRTIADLISEAGGATENSGGTVLLYPAKGGSCDAAPPALQPAATTPAVTIDLNADYGAVNPLLLPVVAGDAIVVNAGRFSVDGWVAKPGVYDLSPGMTAMGGVSAAGGAEFAGDMSHVTVWRAGRSGAREKIEVDMDQVEHAQGKDVTLQSGDVVEVPASPVRLVPYSVYLFMTKVVSMGAYMPMF